MGELINIDANQPHRVSEVICIDCCKRWIAVRPSDVKLKDIQCPECTNQGYVIETGQILDEE